MYILYLDVHGRNAIRQHELELHYDLGHVRLLKFTTMIKKCHYLTITLKTCSAGTWTYAKPATQTKILGIVYHIHIEGEFFSVLKLLQQYRNNK